MLHRNTRGGDQSHGDWRIRRRAPDAGEGGPVFSTGLYWLYEMSHAALNPSRALADVTRLYFKNPLNPLVAHDLRQDRWRRRAELFERSTRRYGKPDWRIDTTTVGGERVPVHITAVWERPFCRLLHFERLFEHAPRRPQPKLADRRADVRPLRHAAARHGRSVPAQSRRLHHRLGRRAHGAAVARAASISTTTSTM